MGDIIICNKGKTDYVIVIDKSSDDSIRAASMLQRALHDCCAITVPIVSDKDAATDREIIVGKTNREGELFEYDRNAILEIGYSISVADERLLLNGGELGGASFAVYEFIKRFLKYDPTHLYAAPKRLECLTVPRDFCFINSPTTWIKNMPERRTDGAHIYMIPTFLRPTGSAAFRGMGYIIRSKNGKIAVIDGGHFSEGAVIVELLRKLTGEDIPTVEYWFMTHIHSDHIDAFIHIGENMPDSIKIKCFCHNTPTEEYCTRWGEAERYTKLKALEERGFCPFKRLKMGDKLHFDGMDVEIVYAFDRELEDYLNERITASEVSINKPTGDAINNSDTLYKFTADGHSALFVGDFMHFGEDFLYERHPEVIENLKADIIQVGHHGANFLSQKFYHHVNARVALWSTTHESWLFSESSLKSIRRRLYQLRLLKNYVSADGIYPIPFDMSEVTDADRSYFEGELDVIDFSEGETDSLLKSHKYDYTLFIKGERKVKIKTIPFNKTASVSVELNGVESEGELFVRHGDVVGIKVKDGQTARKYTYTVLPYPEQKRVLSLDMSGEKNGIMISDEALKFGNGEFTLSVWIKPDEVNVPSTVCYYGDVGTRSPHYTLGFKEIIPAPHKPQIGAPLFTICDPIDKKVSNLYASHPLNAGEWAHVVVVHENINQKIYVNGVFSCERSWGTYTDIAGKNELWIGSAPNGETKFLGEIGEFELYNYAMTDEEIVEIYKNALI